MFQIIKDVTEEVYPGLQIPDEEIGFLVMHFGSVILGMKGARDLTVYCLRKWHWNIKNAILSTSPRNKGNRGNKECLPL